MSLLSQTLKRIIIYLEKKYPHIASNLQPGLSYEEIDRQLSSLPFRLPQEFYELYQWRNGTLETPNVIDFYNNFRFLPLEEAITTFTEIDEFDGYLPYGWIPIFTFEGEYLGVIGSQVQKYASPIVYIYHDETVVYLNITAMMQAIAECYETGVYYLEKHQYGEFIDADRQKEEQIILKYNPTIPTPVSYQDCIREVRQPNNNLSITNIFNRDRTRLISTDIKDYRQNIGKSIEYLGGRIIRMRVYILQHKYWSDRYQQDIRFYTDKDTYEERIITKKTTWFKRKQTTIKRWYVNDILKREKIGVRKYISFFP